DRLGVGVTGYASPAVRVSVDEEQTQSRPDTTAGLGLLLVDAYADRGGCVARDAYTKTVRAGAVSAKSCELS
ncbi:hypothetical protein PV356_29035, partial [Streptomyces sp. WI03-5b]|nr:hypothetical protein [Streptomyces sp. WI03-5b]